MSLENLVNVAKCPTCPNMVPVGRLRPDKPRQCEQCKNKTQNIKRRLQARMRYRNKHKKNCIKCGADINFVKGVRKEICLDCQGVIKMRYHDRRCIYCDGEILDSQSKFCSHKCQQKTLYIVQGRKR